MVKVSQNHGIIAKDDRTKTIVARLYADTKEEVQSEMSIIGLLDGYTLAEESFVVTANGEVAILKSDGTWQWIDQIDLETLLPTLVNQSVAIWLSTHVDPATGYVLDSTLTQPLAAAPAKTVGDKLGEIKSALTDNIEAITKELQIVKSKNLLDVSAMQNGFVTLDGTVSTSDSYKYSEPIEISEGDVLTLYRGKSAGSPSLQTARFITAYDENMNAVSASGVQNDNTYTVPSGIKYIVVSIETQWLTYGFVITLNETSAPTVVFPYFAPYYIAKDAFVADTIDVTLNTEGKSADAKATGDAIRAVGGNLVSVPSFNIFDPSKVNIYNGETKSNGFISSAGTWYSNASYNFLEKIKVKPNVNVRMYYEKNEKLETLNMRFICAYDADGNVLPDKGYDTNKTSYDVPSDVTYISVSFEVSNISSSDKVMMVQNIVTKPSGLVPYASPKMVNVPALYAFLPSDIYCAVGRTIEIYNSQVCLNEQYHIQWDCLYGKALKRKFQIQGTNANVGNHYLALNIYDDAKNCIYSAKATLHIVTGGTTATTICPIGDSLTNAKNWLPEVTNLSNGAYTYVGTYSWTINDADGDSRTGGHEGRSGFSARDYIIGSPYTFGGATETPHNKFWNGSESRFDWDYYKQTYSVNPDCVQIFLGTNRIADNPTDNANYIKDIVDYIIADDPNMPIFLVNTIYRGDQNGIGYQGGVDGYASYGGQWKYNEDIKVFNLMQKLDEIFSTDGYSNVHFVNLALCMDSEYDYARSETTVNPRSNITEEIETEAVHPNTYGYYQMADVMYSVYSAILT